MKHLLRYSVPFVLLWFARAVIAADAPAQPSSPTASMLTLVVPLLAVAIALAALWWIVRRHGGKGGSSGPARIVQVIAVGPRERILVVDHAEQRLLLGVTQTNITLLAHLDPKHAGKLSTNASASPNANQSATFD